MELLILFFVLSIVFSFLCSVWEAVLLSITPSYVGARVQEGSKLGKKLKEFKEDIDRPLSAILTLNTIAHTVGAIGVGAQATKVFPGEAALPLGLTWESIIAGVMTLAILVLSEIIPKTIGANNWKKLAPFTINSLSMLQKVLYPFVWLSQLITKSLKKDKEASVLSRADFMAMANVGMESGAIERSEKEIIHNILGLEQLTIKDVMTPRIVMKSLNEKMTLNEFYKDARAQQFSRIPVYHNSTDNITGIVLKGDILSNIIEKNGNKPLSSVKRPVKMLNQEQTLTELFKVLTDDAEHIAIATDDYGSVTGVVTMEDLFETIIGMEIVDEYDSVEDLQQLARKLWEDRQAKRRVSDPRSAKDK